MECAATSSARVIVHGVLSQHGCDHGHTVGGKAVKRGSLAVMDNSDGYLTLRLQDECKRELYSQALVVPHTLSHSRPLGLSSSVEALVQLAVPIAIGADLSSALTFDSRHVKLKRLVCGQCTRWQTAGRPGRYTNTGHRDKSYGLAEIRSTSVPTACWRPFLSVSLRLVGDQFFQCAYSLLEIDPCFYRHHPGRVVLCSHLILSQICVKSFRFLCTISFLRLALLSRVVVTFQRDITLFLRTIRTVSWRQRIRVCPILASLSRHLVMCPPPHEACE